MHCTDAMLQKTAVGLTSSQKGALMWQFCRLNLFTCLRGFWFLLSDLENILKSWIRIEKLFIRNLHILCR